MSATDLAQSLDSLALVDHHTHGVFSGPIDRDTFEITITECSETLPDLSHFDSQIGFAILAHCAPVLDLEPHCTPNTYLERRNSLSVEEVTRRFLGGAGVSRYLIDTGFQSEQILDVPSMVQASGTRCEEIVRLEVVAEEIVRSGTSAAGFAQAFTSELGRRLGASGVGTKSIAAYRYGLDLAPERPEPGAVRMAASRWLTAIAAGGAVRLDDPTLLRFLMWAGIDAGVPLQIHVGYGDLDLELARCNPLLLTDFMRRTRSIGTPVMLLHCYPYHREAGYLAQVFPHVYFDVGFLINFIGVRSLQLVAESLELAPFGKQLYSSDAWGLPELHYLGARLWRRAMAKVLGEWVESGDWSHAGALRAIELIGVENATRVYGLGD